MGVKRWLRRASVGLTLVLLASCGSLDLKPWHTIELEEEFDHRDASIQTFDDYLALESRLFDELDERIYATGTGTDPETLSRYRSGSIADLRSTEPYWNRSLEFAVDDPRGGVLLLHGMSDSPYSLHRFSDELVSLGYYVLALRYPGHGTIPSGLRQVSHEDMSAAVHLAAVHLSERLAGAPMHIIGYSTGATLGLEYAMDALEQGLQHPASLVLISPAIRVHASASLAGFTDSASGLPGSSNMAWLSILPEPDPYKYNSFPTNAAAVVNSLTRSVDRRVARLGPTEASRLPPILALKSTVDTTVTTEAIVDRLLEPLGRQGNELILFDINQRAARNGLLAVNQDAFTRRLQDSPSLAFDLTIVGNASADTRAAVATTRPAGSSSAVTKEELGVDWPPGVLSLSHIALPFAPDDPLYGAVPPEGDAIWLGNTALRGERGVSAFPPDFLLRMRHNPFFGYALERVLAWIDSSDRTGSESD